jgi:energy-coupling factor transport system substrate-specific component
MASVASPIARVPRFARFLLCGGIAAAGNWSSRFLWSLVLPFGAAVIAAYATGMVIAFTLFRAFVFEAGENGLAVQARNFVLVNLIGMAATWALAQLLVLQLFPAIGMTFHPHAIGHGIAIVAPALTSWFGHRLLTFR